MRAVKNRYIQIIEKIFFEKNENRIAISSEKHYRLVPPEEMTPADLEKYQQHSI